MVGYYGMGEESSLSITFWWLYLSELRLFQLWKSV
jgi:hypothetical protein